MFRSKNIKSELLPANGASLASVSFIFRSNSPLDNFLHHERELSGNEKSIRIYDDVYMLFNQDRLDRMTKEALLSYINDNITSSDSLSSFRKKMTDSQLLKFIKSRYIQAPSDLQNWSKYLEQMADSELSLLREAVEVNPPSGNSPSSEPSNE